MRKVFLFTVIFIAGGAISLYGQNFPNLRFSHLTTRDGLSTNQVSCAFRDSHGIMWFGTLKGLNRYDGSGFKVFLSRYKDSTSLPNNHIVQIAEDKEGMLWVNADGILCRFDPATEKVIAIYRNLPLRSLIIDSKMRLWVNSYTSVYRLDYNNNSVIQYTVPTILLNSDRFEFISLYEDQAKNILAVTTRGIGRLDTIEKKIVPSAGNFYTPFSSFYQDSEKNFWAGIWPGGIEKIPVGQTYIYPESLKDTLCLSMTEWKDNAGENFLMVAFPGGIRLIHIKTGQWHNYLSDRNYTESNNISTFPNIYKDPDNRIWICNTNGVDIIDPYLQGVHNIYPLKDHTIDNTWGNAISLLETDNEYYVGRDRNNGLAVFDKKWNSRKVIMPGGTAGSITSISNDDHHYWYAISGGLIKQQGSRYIKIKPFAGDPRDDNFFTNIVSKDSHYKWVLSSVSGVYLLNSKEDHFVKKYLLNNTAGENGRGFYTKMFSDQEGGLWVAATNGFYFYNKTTDLFEFKRLGIESNDNKLIQDAVTDDGHMIWFITKDVLGSFDTHTGKVFTYNTSNGFTGNNLLNIGTDDLGNVWIKSNTELACLHKVTGVFTYFDEQSGLPVDNWKEWSLFHKLQNGNLVIGGENIITELNPPILLNNKAIPPVYLEDAEINNVRIQVQYDKNGNKRIVLQPGQSSIAAHFGILNYTLPLKNRYYYKMDELDLDWHLCRDGNLNYNNLKPGTYHLHFKGANNTGVENITGDALVIIVKPSFYQTGWFYGLCGVLVLFVIWRLFMLREKRKLAQQQLRDKIARDLHDDVGSTLSGINLFSKLALQKMDGSASTDLIKKIAERSENMVGAMSDIVWSVDPVNDNIDKIIIRMRAYALDMLEEQDMKLNFSFPPNMNRTRMSVSVRKDFYLIYKEAVNNIAKYSQATEVHVMLQLKKGKLLLQIKDNGKGFDTSLYSGGNGLRNMRARAVNIGADMQLHSDPGKGTLINLAIPV